MARAQRSEILSAILRASVDRDLLDDDLVASTIADFDAILSSWPLAARTTLAAGLQVLELGSLRPGVGFRRMSRLAPEAASGYLAGWLEGSSSARRVALLARDLLLLAFYEQPRVARSVGYRPDPHIAAVAARRRVRWAGDIEAHALLLEAPRPLRRPIGSGRPSGAIRPGDDLPEAAEFDVVVVGSGAGGAVVAAELGEAGLSVAVLEEGRYHATDDFGTNTLDALRNLYRDGGAASTLGRAPVQFSEGRCVGGSTVVNGGMAFRASDRTLDRWARTAGLRALDLDSEYARVERFLSVGEPDPESIGRDQHLLKSGADRLGWRVVANQRAHVHCGGCNVCVWGCPTGAKQSTLVTYLPRAIRFGATVWTQARVARVLFNGKRAIGVLAEVGDRKVTVRARHVVVAAGAVQTPALLQRSRISTPSGQIGRNLTIHPGAAVAAVFEEHVDGWTGAHQSYQIREFVEEGIILAAVNLPPSLVTRMIRLNGSELTAEMAEYSRMVTAGVLVEDTGTGRVRATGPRQVTVTYPVTPRDAARITRALTLLGEALFSAGAQRIHLPISGVAVTSPTDLHQAMADPIPPARLDLSTVHLMGTARLGADPVVSVCDPHGAVYDAARLSVADASLFPGAVGVNPQLTVMAIATRVAGRIIDEW